ncbi:hypothetical protein HQ487_04065 [Candidatus Uhrbacteria bacterium]|nr:hypothetical protein [Candidatus Uhrbacteria bacterium]
MNETPITGQSIWNALRAESGFLEHIPESAHTVWEQMCEAAAPVIEPFADQLITVDSFMSAKLAILKMMIEGEWMQKILTAYPEEAFPLGMKAMFQQLVAMLEGLMEQFTQIDGNYGEILAAQGINEEQFLMHAEGGRFTLDTAIKWREGNFTIGDLATTQPSSLFRND